MFWYWGCTKGCLDTVGNTMGGLGVLIPVGVPVVPVLVGIPGVLILADVPGVLILVGVPVF
jgi:hypothetical protein